MAKSKIIEIEIIKIGGTSYSGLSFDILYIDSINPNIDSSLFGINVSERFLYISLFWNTIKIFDRNE